MVIRFEGEEIFYNLMINSQQVVLSFSFLEEIGKTRGSWSRVDVFPSCWKILW